MQPRVAPSVREVSGLWHPSASSAVASFFAIQRSTDFHSIHIRCSTSSPSVYLVRIPLVCCACSDCLYIYISSQLARTSIESLLDDIRYDGSLSLPRPVPLLGTNTSSIPFQMHISCMHRGIYPVCSTRSRAVAGPLKAWRTIPVPPPLPAQRTRLQDSGRPAG